MARKLLWSYLPSTLRLPNLLPSLCFPWREAKEVRKPLSAKEVRKPLSAPCLHGLQTCIQPQRPTVGVAQVLCPAPATRPHSGRGPGATQFISCYSVSNLWGVFVKLSQGDQRLLPETHTFQKSQGGILNLLSRMRAVFLHRTLQDPRFICPQSHFQWLLQIPAGGWKQMAA